MFFEELEKQCDQVRSFRGELPHTDYVVGATSTAKETSVNRLAHRQWHAAEKLATVVAITCDMHFLTPQHGIPIVMTKRDRWGSCAWQKLHPSTQEREMPHKSRRSTVEWDRDAEIRPFIHHFASASPPVAGRGAQGTFSDITQRGLCHDGYPCRCSWDSDLLALVVRVRRIL